jgi:hypothetical protein
MRLNRPPVSSPSRPRRGLAIGGAVGFLVLWLLVELLFLRGTVVQRGTITLGTPYALTVTESSAPHTIEIGGRRRGTRPPKFRIHLRVTDPEGASKLDDDESFARNGIHLFSFTPDRAGTYVVDATDGGLAGRNGASMPIVVTIHDRRLLTKLLF